MAEEEGSPLASNPDNSGDHTAGELRGCTMNGLMQLMETDQRTCLVEIKGDGLQRGSFYFQDGTPIDASCGSLTGEEAALAMVGWEMVDATFLKDPGPCPERTIETPVMGLLMEGMRIKDEQQNQEQQTEDQDNNGGEAMAGLKQMVKDIADEMDGVIAIGIVGMDGITVAAHNPTGADMDVVSAKFAMVMKLVERSVEELNSLGNYEENLVQTANAWILTRFLDKSYYLACIVSRDGTLGNVRLVAKKYLEQLQRAL